MGADQSIVFIATAWGPRHGGINAFNLDVCMAIAEKKSCSVICCVLSATSAEIESARLAGVHLLSLDERGDDFFKSFASSVVRRVRDAGLGTVAWWIGHDSITGPVALAAKAESGASCAVIHHMDYGSYKTLEGAEASAAMTKADEQGRIFRQADIVFSVGPKLRSSAEDMLVSLPAANRPPVVELIPGLPSIEPIDGSSKFRVITFGRLAARIKQTPLAVASFGRALRESGDILGSDPSLMLMGGVEGKTAAEQKSAREELERLAHQYAGRQFALLDLPYEMERQKLFDRLRQQSVAMMLSIHEGFGLAAWETIAAGVPLVVTRNSGLFELLRLLHEDGLVWSVDIKGASDTSTPLDEDVAAVAAQLRNIALSPTPSRERARKLREVLINKYSWASTADDILGACKLPRSGHAPGLNSVHQEQPITSKVSTTAGNLNSRHRIDAIKSENNGMVPINDSVNDQILINGTIQHNAKLRRAASSQLTAAQVRVIRKRWQSDTAFLGFPDAERDAVSQSSWLEHLLVRPEWFHSATQRTTTLLVGRKGVGKSAARIAAIAQANADGDIFIIQASADELAARHASRLQQASERGFGAVADWCHVFAELIVRRVAIEIGLNSSNDPQMVQMWATIDGVSEHDFGERISSAIRLLVQHASGLAGQRGQAMANISRPQLARIDAAKSYALYIDDFDNLQETRNVSLVFANLRLIRDAVEAADRITHQNQNASIHLLMRQDLWLRLRPGWHYADKIAGLVQLNWTQDNLAKWADRRLRLAAATALGTEPSDLEAVKFSDLWGLFFPENVVLRNDKESTGLHYIVRRTMYTPRGLRQFLALIIQRARRFPANLRDVEDAEEEFSTDQLEFLKTEFGGLCQGLDICLQSFTGKQMEMRATDLYRHLKGLIGNGQVRLSAGASDGDDAIAVARFLFRIGFLEVRYGQEDRFEVRDAMRHPDHWKSIRKDDAVTWAVRSAFFCVLRSHRS